MNDEPLPRTIDAYLAQLRQALAGADKALIQDALYDAEEYLRNEVRESPGKSEQEILAAIARSYGAPSEVADAYRQTEHTVQAALNPPARKRPRATMGKFFGVMADPQAYMATLFLLLGLPVGVFLFTWVVTGISLSIGLSLMIFGLPLFLLFLASVRFFSLVEGRMIEGLLGVRMPRRPVHPGEPRVWWRRIVEMFTDARTWSAIFYMLLKLPLGVGSFVLVVTGLSFALSLITSPVVEGVFHEHVLYWDGASMYAPVWLQPVMVVGGILLLVALMHVFRWVALIQAHIGRGLLVKSGGVLESRSGKDAEPVADADSTGGA